MVWLYGKKVGAVIQYISRDIWMCCKLHVFIHLNIGTLLLSKNSIFMYVFIVSKLNEAKINPIVMNTAWQTTLGHTYIRIFQKGLVS